MVEFTPLSYGNYTLSDWSQAVGWLIAVSPVSVIPVFAVYQFITLSRRSPYSQLSFCPVTEHVVNWHYCSTINPENNSTAQRRSKQGSQAVARIADRTASQQTI